MPLIHAPVCSQCKQHRTTHSSGVCSRCRRLKGQKLCISCGDRETSHESGLCYRCRSKAVEHNDLDHAIAHYKEVLLALEMLKSGSPYRAIGEVLGKSKAGAYTFCQSALRYPLVREE